jgi:LysM repeat protein
VILALFLAQKVYLSMRLSVGVGISFVLTGLPGINVLTGVSVASFLAVEAVKSVKDSKYLNDTEKYIILGIIASACLILTCTVTFFPTARYYFPQFFRQTAQADPTPTQQPAQASLLIDTPIQVTPAFLAENLAFTLVSTLVPTSVLLPTQLPTPIYSEAGYCMYVVQPGDTLQGIAIRFQLNEGNLKSGDKLLDWGAFTPNQLIRINAPCCSPQGGNGFSYTVQSGETLFSIARRYGVSAERLVTINNLYNPGYIQFGQMLCIPWQQ